jgi:hypothetical protein
MVVVLEVDPFHCSYFVPSIQTHGLPEICAVLGYYVVPMFWDNLSDPSSRVKSQRLIYCPKMLVNDYRTILPHNIPEEHTSHHHCAGSLKSKRGLSANIVNVKMSTP